MRLRKVEFILTLALGILVTSLTADAQDQVEGEGRVILVDPAGGTVGLDHGPIPGIMPPMRMRFSIERAELLQGLQVGDQVRFTLILRDFEWIIATIIKAPGQGNPEAK